jgi:hypothetical protein
MYLVVFAVWPAYMMKKSSFLGVGTLKYGGVHFRTSRFSVVMKFYHSIKYRGYRIWLKCDNFVLVRLYVQAGILNFLYMGWCVQNKLNGTTQRTCENITNSDAKGGGGSKN